MLRGISLRSPIPRGLGVVWESSGSRLGVVWESSGSRLGPAGDLRSLGAGEARYRGFYAGGVG